MIVGQPTNQTIRLGEAAAFAVTATGTEPLAYQWSFGGTNLVDATNSVLLIPSVQVSDAGSYAVGVSNAFGSANSSNALLTVGEPPTIVIQPTDQAVPVGEMATFNVVAEGTPPFSYQWSFNGTNLLEATNSVLVITNAQLSDAGDYAVEVANAFGSEDSSNAVLIVGEPPMIVGQPTNQTIRLGEAAAFAVTATGTAPLAYQWSFGGTNLADATNSVLLIPSVQVSDAGSYAVGVSNAFGSANSSNALLTVGESPTIVIQPTNLAVPLGGMAAFNVLAEGTPPFSYQWSFNGTNLVEATNSVLVITNAQLSDAGDYAVEVANAFGSEDSSNAVLIVGEPPVIVGQPTNQTIGLGEAAAFAVTATGTAPLAYQWSFGGTNLVDATNSVLLIPSVQVSDAGSYSVGVSNAFGSTNSSNALLTVGEPPTIVIQPTNVAVPVGEMATFNVVAEGTPPFSYQWSFNGTNLLEATNSVLVITNAQLSDAGDYAVEVANAFGSEDSSNAVLTVGEPPMIVGQPTNQTIRLGEAAAFAVTATGTAPLAYQWSFGGTNLADATNSVLLIPSVQVSDAGSYSVGISNAFGSTNSSNALLTVGEPPTIVIQPADRAVPVGEMATFNVVAEGTPPFSYQWSFNGTNLLEATNSVLVITNAQLSDAGDYAVEVANAFGSEAAPMPCSLWASRP